MHQWWHCGAASHYVSDASGAGSSELRMRTTNENEQILANLGKIERNRIWAKPGENGPKNGQIWAKPETESFTEF